MVICPAAEGDADAMAGFRCSTGPWYEQEVESFVRRHALERALTVPGYRLLLAFESDRLVCCMAHHREFLFREGSTAYVLAVRLHVLAIAVEDQGRRLDDGTRLSDTLMAALISDAMADREETLTAIVAIDNLRSIALCKRRGLRSQVQRDARHVRLSGHFTPRR